MSLGWVQPAVGPAEPDRAKALKLLRPVLGISAVMVLAKLCGFGEKMLIAYYYGTSGKADVYFMVLSLVWVAVYMTRELVHPSLLPVFTRSLRRPETPAPLFGRMFLWVAGLAVLSGLVALAAAPLVVALAAPGFDDGQAASAATLLRLCVPGAAVLMTIAVTSTCLNARKSFVKSAVADLLSKVLLLGVLALLTSVLGLHAVGPALLVAAVAALVFHLACLPDRAGVLRWRQAPAPGQLDQVRRLMLPLVLGVVFSHVANLADNMFASKLPKGHLSMLNYARKVIETVMLVGPAALATVLFAHSAELLASNRKRQRRRLVTSSLRLLVFLTVPAAFLLWEFRRVVIEILFVRGRFTIASAQGAGDALGVYSLGLVTLTAEAVLVYCFYARCDTRTPVLWGVLFAGVNVALAALLVGPTGFLGIAAAFVVAKTGKVAVLWWLLCRDLGSLLGRKVPRFLGVVLVSTALAVGVVLLSRLGVEGFLGIRPGLVVLLCYVLVAVAGYLATAWWAGSSEARRVVWATAGKLCIR